MIEKIFRGKLSVTSAIILAAVTLAVVSVIAVLATGSCGSRQMLSTVDSSWVRINEVMSSNSYFAPLADGSCHDWVEIYNPSEESIDLRGFGLSDNPDKPLKWKIPLDITLQPGEYAVVYLSGLDKVDDEGNMHANFRLSSEGETLIFSSSDGGLIQQIEIPLCTTENISYGIDERSEEEGYVWMAEPSPGRACTGDTSKDSGGLTYSYNGVVINEYMTNNTFTLYDKDGEYSDWVELYNPTDTDAVMSGCSLSDNGTDGGRWYFPDGAAIPAGGYLVVFCSGKTVPEGDTSGELHASFRLGSGDTSLVLFSASGLPMDTVTLHDLPENVSCGADPASGELKLYSSPTPGTANSTYAHALTEAVYGVPSAGVMISETLSVSSSRGSSADDYVELHNTTSQSLSLEGFGLSDSADEVAFVFPAVSIPAGGYITIKCTGKNNYTSSPLCAAFKLGGGGDTVYLTDSAGHIIDKFSTGRQLDGVSRGRLEEKPYEWYYFSKPTIGKANSKSSAYKTYAAMPSMSTPGGEVEKGTVVYINVPQDCTVRYTTDGSLPDNNSKQYDPQSGITINKTTVIQAAAFEEGSLPSQTVTTTYFVDISHTLPIVSMTSDPEGLFSYKTGIYTAYSSYMLGDKPNYESEEERLSSIEYYVDGKRAVSFNAGARIFGTGSRTYGQRSFALMLREIYGADSVHYPFFGEDGADTFSSLVLRQSGQECKYSKLRDELCALIVKGRVECDIMDATPVVLYLNGEYWGLYYIREKLNEDYLVNKYGYTKGKIDIVKFQAIAQSGSMKDFKYLENFVRTHDLTKEENYKQVCDMVDIESLMDYWICETFFANNDTDNIRSYKSHDEGAKWRWMLYDLDNACYRYLLRSDKLYDNMLDLNGHGMNGGRSTALTRKLLENEDFKQRFVERYCYHLKTTFAPERTTAMLEELASQIEGEIPAQHARWTWPSVETWNNHIRDIRNFLNQRQEYVEEHIKDNLDISDAEFQKIYDAA